jgi:hypothetical protein
MPGTASPEKTHKHLLYIKTLSLHQIQIGAEEVVRANVETTHARL